MTEAAPRRHPARRGPRRREHAGRTGGAARRPLALPLFLLLLPALAGCPPPAEEREAGMPGEPPGTMTPEEAEEIFDGDSARIVRHHVMESLGGEDAWDRTRFISFRWLVEREGEVVSDRRHAWDRFEGSYRLESEQEGSELLALFDVQAVDEDDDFGKLPEGRAWRDGQELEGAARDTLLSRAYRVFINDTYWLLMPFKWDDPGVHLAYEGRQTLPDGREYEVVHLSFDEGVGITHDRYWGYVDPETGRMEAWRFHLQGQEEPGPLIWWEDWRQVGPIRLAGLRRSEEGPVHIRFTDLEASAEAPSGAFDPPAPEAPAGGPA